MTKYRIKPSPKTPSPGMWKVLRKLSLQFRNPWSNFPYTVSIKQMKQLPLTTKNKFKLKMSAILLLLHTIYCFFSLCRSYQFIANLSENTKCGQISFVQIFQLFFFTVLPLCFLTISYIISFTTKVLPVILKPNRCVSNQYKL